MSSKILMKWRGTVGTNIGRWLASARLGTTLVGGWRYSRRHGRSHGGGSPELDVYGPPNLGFRRGLHLRHGCDLENLLCSPWEDGGQQWQRLPARRLGLSSTSMSVAFEAPPATGSSPTASSWAPLAPWPLNCLQEVVNRAHAVTFSLRYGSGLWAKFDELGPLYIGLLVSTCRGFGILTNVSPTRFRIIADKVHSRRG
jgi:hypothetical protein